jgi:hypothetical protein
MHGWESYGFGKKCTGTRYTELVFFYSVGFVGHVLHFGVSGAGNIDALFIMLRWERYGFYKKRTATRYTELVFFHAFGSMGHVPLSGASGPRNVDALFSA